MNDINDTADGKATKKSAKYDSGAADLERVTDYAEEKEISSDLTGDLASIGEKRQQEVQKKAERTVELAKVVVKKEDIELIMNEMEISRQKADRCLREHGGDVALALISLVG